MISSINISSIKAARKLDFLQRHRVNHVISLLDPEDLEPMYKFFSSIKIPWDYFVFKDTEFSHVEPPKPELRHSQRLIEIFNGLIASDKKINLLIHCRAGISRSTAAAYILLYLLHKDKDIALEKLLEIRDIANPNLLVLEYADQILGTYLSDHIYNWRVINRVGKIIIPHNYN